MPYQDVTQFHTLLLKGNAKALGVIKKHPHLKLEVIGEEHGCIKYVLSAGQEFMCLLYGVETPISMTELRHKIFSSKRSTPSIKTLPPTDASLECHILRAHLQTMLWKAADKKDPPSVDYTQYGWEMIDGTLRPKTGISTACAPEIMKVVACIVVAHHPSHVLAHLVVVMQLDCHAPHIASVLVMQNV